MKKEIYIQIKGFLRGVLAPYLNDPNASAHETSKSMRIRKIKEGAENNNTRAQNLYITLKNENLEKSSWVTEDLGEEMTLVSKSLFGWWKPVYVMDHRNKTAFRFMDSSMCLAFATTDDIDWESLEGIDSKAHQRAEELDAQFPTWIRNYKNGVAQVSWQLNPDGRYYMDDDGFGMTDDEELEIYGYIDRTGKVLAKFKHVREDWDEVQRMRTEAEKLAKR